MAITTAEVSVTWATGDYSDSIGAGGSETSDEYNLDATCIAAQIQCKADNSTTAASDDIIYFWLVQTLGDPDGNAVGDEFDTTGAGILLAVLDTSDEDPKIKTVALPIPSKGFKIYAEGITAGSTNAVTVGCVVFEQRAA